MVDNTREGIIKRMRKDVVEMQGILTRNRAGYYVWATEAESRHWGGISVEYREKAGW